MLIKIESLPEEKPLFELGQHIVEISSINDGLSEQKQTPFFQCKFENSGGFIRERYYNTENSLWKIIDLFRACGFEVKANTTLDTADLIGKKLEIEIGEEQYIDRLTGEVKQAKRVVKLERFGEGDEEGEKGSEEGDLPF